MYCMKCGTKAKDSQVFCDACLAVMEQFPVNSDVHVQLPSRPVPEKRSAPRKKDLTPEEQLLRLRRSVKRLSLVLACTLLALGLTVTLLVHTYTQQDTHGDIGKNYSTVNTDHRAP